MQVQKKTETFQRFLLTVKAEGFAALDKTNLKVAAVPSYENHSLLVKAGDLELRPAVRVETPREILSDKLCAFGSRDYLKGRDIWDLHYLIHELHVEVDEDTRKMAIQKVSDYGVKPGIFVSNLGQRINQLSLEGGRILRAEMDRFLPAAYRKVFQPGYSAICLDAAKIEEISAEIYRPSYISLESALSRYGILSQIPYVLTCVTPRNPRIFQTSFGTIEYRGIQKKYFFGRQNHGNYSVAEPEKALLDFIYLHKRSEIESLISEWDLRSLSAKKLKAYAKRMKIFLPQGSPSRR